MSKKAERSLLKDKRGRESLRADIKASSIEREKERKTCRSIEREKERLVDPLKESELCWLCVEPKKLDSHTSSCPRCYECLVMLKDLPSRKDTPKKDLPSRKDTPKKGN